MKVAILLSTYNGDNYIRDQIESILSQKTDAQFDVFIRDDGSQDNTLDVIESYIGTGKISILSGNSNLKSAKSFMTLLFRCTGYDFYFFSDQDDVWEQDKIEQGLIKISKINGPALYHGNAHLVDFNLSDLKKNVYKKKPHTDIHSIFCSCNVQGCTVIINESLASIIRKGGMPENIVMHDAYIARVCSAINGIILYDHVPHILYRQHNANVIGIDLGFKAKLTRGIREIKSKNPISISIQASEILNRFDNLISEENKKWLRTVSEYKKSFLSRLNLAFSPKCHYISCGRSIITRLCILLGNK